MKIRNEVELDDILSRPSDADIQAFKDLPGDLLILGAAGKMGPSLVRRARRAADQSGVKRRVIGVDLYPEGSPRQTLESWGVETVAADLLDAGALAGLPDAPNVIFMAGRKFGSTGAEHLTWAMNVLLPAMVAQRFRESRIVVFSSGNIYPFAQVAHGGATEAVAPSPVGEYAQSVLGRERMFEHFSLRYGTRVTLLRVNYAIDLRYGVLYDVGVKVFERRPVDLTMGHANVIWQGDANSAALRALSLCQSPPFALNLTGPETIPIRWAARRFADHFGVDPVFEGTESQTALLNNAARCFHLLGYPSVSPEQMIEWIAEWIAAGGQSLNKPTHFEVRDGKF